MQTKCEVRSSRSNDLVPLPTTNLQIISMYCIKYMYNWENQKKKKKKKEIVEASGVGCCVCCLWRKNELQFIHTHKKKKTTTKKTFLWLSDRSLSSLISAFNLHKNVLIPARIFNFSPLFWVASFGTLCGTPCQKWSLNDLKQRSLLCANLRRKKSRAPNTDATHAPHTYSLCVFSFFWDNL